MSKLAGISGKEAIKKFGRLGYQVVRQKGSHVRLHAPGKKPITIPLHKELKIGLLLQLIQDAGSTIDLFIDL